MILGDFRSIEPAFALGQDAALHWLALAHARAEQLAPDRPGLNADESFASKVTALFRRYGCRSEQIRTRRVEVADFTHTRWDEMAQFSFSPDPRGPTTDERAKFFHQAGGRVCARV